MPLTYLLKRIAQLVLVIFIAVTINFMIPRMISGDPIESALQTRMAMSGTIDVNVQEVAASYHAKFGLDKPLWRQYLTYWNDIFHLDLGVSLADFPQSVSSKVMGALPWTLGLLLTSTLIAFVLGTIMGALLAWPGAPKVLQVMIPPLMFLSAIPFFLLGLILLAIFAAELRIFPPGGGFDTAYILRLDLPSFFDILYHAILPSLALILGSTGIWMLGMRGMMVSVLGEDYITFAEAKGLSGRRIFLRYGARNALLPQVTHLAFSLGSVLSGAVLVEAMFNYPGLGGLLFAAIAGKDYFVIQGIMLMLVIALALALFFVDLLYPFIDPRIRY